MRISRAEDPFVRAFDICEDTFRHGSRVAIKDYSSCTEQGCEDVLMSTSFPIKILKVIKVFRK